MLYVSGEYATSLEGQELLYCGELIDLENRWELDWEYNVRSAVCTMILFIFRTFLYLVFVLVLGSTCERTALLTDYMIAAKVSAVRKYHLFVCFKLLLEHVTKHHGWVCSITALCFGSHRFWFCSGDWLSLMIFPSPSRQMPQ